MNNGYLLPIILLLSSCTVGPDYIRPKLALPEKWENAAPVVESTPQESLADWWKQFNDPVLDSLLATAVEKNLDLKQAAARLREARAFRRGALAEFFPQIDGNVEYQRQRNRDDGSNVGQASPGGVVSTGTERDLFQAGFDAAWELDVFGGTRRAYESAAASEQAALEDQRDVHISLLAETASTYLTLRSAQDELAITRHNLELQRKNLSLTEQRFSSGFAGALDVANAKAEVERTSADVPALEISVKQQLYALAVLLGSHPGGLPSEVVSGAPLPAVPSELPAVLPSELLERRPDIRRADAELHAATAEIGVAKADWFPRFSLTGALSVTGDSASSLTDWDNRVARFGPSVFWPIFDAGRISSNIEIQNARTEQALAVYEKTILIAFQDVETSLVSFVKQREREAALAASVRANREALDLSTKLYREGLSDFLSVLTAERALLVSEIAETQSRRQQGLALIALYKALGGGWVENSQ